FVIIDEVHYFMASPRGTQLICLLERIEKLTACHPRRIGLSATIGNSADACRWISAGTDRFCQAPAVNGGVQKLALFMQRFCLWGNSKEEQEEEPLNPELTRYYEFLYQSTLNKKSIIFANSRAAVESTIAHLRAIAQTKKTPDVYKVHHGSISAALRETAEKEMKRSDLPIVTGATVTLELGIDIGSLDRIVQLGAPLSVSSFTQRIGRCGRKGQLAELIFAFIDRAPANRPDLLTSINWEFIKTIAIIQLLLEEKWVEPLRSPGHSFGLLYHQTMSFLLANGSASPAGLAQNVLGLHAFKQIEQEDYRTLLRHLLKIGHLEQTDRGHLVIGYQAEPIVTGFQFYAVFESADEYEVKHQGESIGSVMEPYPVGTKFALAGKAWETVKVNEKAKIIFVKAAKGVPAVSWISPSQLDLHTKVLQKMRDVLVQDEEYAYLSASCKSRLGQIRELARLSGISGELVVPLREQGEHGEQSFAVLPWLGTRQLYTLLLALKQRGVQAAVAPGGFLPICLEVEYDGDKTGLTKLVKNIARSEIDKYTFTLPDKIQIPSKFNKFIPKELLVKEFLEDYIDIEGFKTGLDDLYTV
ncbi:MAG: ATP-dependent helicase, partial [Firmicutes bacterium]|nr:ATP-dependent helicase [Bacillota bacterium]